MNLNGVSPGEALTLAGLCLVLAACIARLPGQKERAFSDNPTPPGTAAYCCAVKAVFRDEQCTTRPVVPQPAWDRAVKICMEGR